MVVNSGIRIMSILFMYISDEFLKYKKDLYSVFQQGLISND